MNALARARPDPLPAALAAIGALALAIYALAWADGYGLRVLSYQMPYQADPAVGTSIANSFLTTYKNPQTDEIGRAHV